MRAKDDNAESVRQAYVAIVLELCMSRRRKSILEDLVEMPWWVSPTVAAMVFIGARWLAPLILTDHWLGRSLGSALSSSAPILAVVFLLPVPFAALHQWRDRRRLAATKSWATIREMPWHEFELLLATAFRRIGYDVEVRGGGGADGGVDLVLSEEGKKTLVQCKHWNRQQVGVGVVRELYGVMNAEVAEAGIIVTGGAFSEDARAFAHDRQIELVDGPKLQTLLGYVRDGKLSEATVAVDDSASCPQCGGAMLLRRARRGANAGKDFWGCSRYPACRGTRPA